MGQRAAGPLVLDAEPRGVEGAHELVASMEGPREGVARVAEELLDDARGDSGWRLDTVNCNQFNAFQLASQSMQYDHLHHL